MLSNLTLLTRARDFDFLDPQTWLTFAVLALITAASAWALTHRFEWGLLALRNRFGGRWSALDELGPRKRRLVPMVYGPAVAGVTMGVLLAVDAAGVGFYLAYDQLASPGGWDWLGYALMLPLGLMALSLATLLAQLVYLFRIAGLLVAPLYLAVALTAFAAAAAGAPLVAIALLPKLRLLNTVPALATLLATYLRGLTRFAPEISRGADPNAV